MRIMKNSNGERTSLYFNLLHSAQCILVLPFVGVIPIRRGHITNVITSGKRTNVNIEFDLNCFQSANISQHTFDLVNISLPFFNNI